MKDNTQTTEDINIDDMLNAQPSMMPPVTKKPEDTDPKLIDPKPADPVVSKPDTKNTDLPDAKSLLSSFSGDIEDEVNKSLKADLLAEYKGTAFDKEGNIIDADGKVVKTVEEVIKELAEEEEPITLDAEGNQVDADGKVIKTKDELAKEAKASTPIVNEILQELEYDMLDENGKPKVYSDDAAGVKELATDYANALLADFKADFFNSNPELAEVAKHILAGNKLETFNSSVDYTKIDVAKLTDDELVKYIKQSYKNTGLSDERIEGMVSLFKDGNKLKEEGAFAVAALIEQDKNAKAQRDLDYRNTVQADNEKQLEYWQNVKSTIDKGDLGIANIPKNEQEAFYNYMSSAVDRKGNSKEQLDRQSETLEQKVALAYYRFKGFDLTQLIKNKAQTSKVDTLRKRMSEAAKINYSSSTYTGKKSANKATSDDISIDDMLS